jgi:hypothetical protein
MSSTVFKHAIPVSNGPQTHILDHMANGLLLYSLLSPDMSSLFETIYKFVEMSIFFTISYILKLLYNVNVLYICIYIYIPITFLRNTVYNYNSVLSVFESKFSAEFHYSKLYLHWIQK